MNYEEELKKIRAEEIDDNESFSNMIISREDADKAFRTIQFYQQQIDKEKQSFDRAMEQIELEKEKLEYLYKKAIKHSQERIEWHANELEVYQREEGIKTIKTPFGSSKLKKQQPEYRRDNVVLLEYAKDHELVKVKEEVDWAALKKKLKVVGDKAVDENGEIVPGVVVIEREPKFEFEVE